MEQNSISAPPEMLIPERLFRSGREYKKLIEAVRASAKANVKHPLCVTGLSEGATDIFTQCLAGDVTHGIGRHRMLVLLPEEKDAVTLRDRLVTRGLSAMLFPVREYSFGGAAMSHEYEHARLRVLSALSLSDEAFIICSTSPAVLQATMRKTQLWQSTVTVDSQTPCDPEKLCERLISAGYVRVEFCEGAGQFARRGDIVDIFAPGDVPYRIEFFGDEIDRIAPFDIASQRSGETVGGITIPPAREIILTSDVRREIAASVSKQKKKLESAKGEERVTDLLASEIAALENDMPIDFADKYLPYISDGVSCLLDYFDGVCLISDSSAAKKKSEDYEAFINQSVADMLEDGELAVRKNAAYFAGFGRINEMMRNVPTVIADAFRCSYEGAAASFDFATRHTPVYNGNTTLLFEDLQTFAAGGYVRAVAFDSETEAEGIAALMREVGIESISADSAVRDYNKITESGGASPVILLAGLGIGGFESVAPKFVILDYSNSTRAPKKRSRIKAPKRAANAIMSYNDLTVGDLVVHAAYGIGQYMGLENLTVDGVSRDYVYIKYAGRDKLFLPVDQLDMVSKYIGAGAGDGSGGVKLSKMGGADWLRAKSRAKGAARDMAKELIELYARRQRTPGLAAVSDDEMSLQFADAFEYEETDSQLRAIEDVSRDMEKACPMDRIICGDVGYGKTEVALRAAFKEIRSGRQVALLVPTTILAYQHFQTAQSRFRGFPVTVDMLSRFRTSAQQTASLRRLKRGETDLIIGTHRIISKDVEFKNLGLVIVDEEQRFGVAQKEKLKQIAANADVLTLTATPIPRTLNMAMSGILDMSLLEDVPGMRQPVQTYVMEHDEGIIGEVIRRELRRGGQVFYLHNRIESIYNVAGRLSRQFPDAHIAVAHGRTEKDQLEEIWQSLVDGETDILVCTTIIETGVDVPNANTLIIEHADCYGLSQLHQLRGRVGRSSRRAYAYFTYPRMKQLSEISEKRLRAIKEYASFGAGFRIALRDLEIRGAGNILGAEQHGHMDAVGYDMYVKLLNEAVLEEQGTVVEPEPECSVSMRTDAYISKNYIPDPGSRIEMYKKIALIACSEDMDDVIGEFLDRFGEMPREAVSLCRAAYLKSLGKRCGFKKLDERDGELVFVPSDTDITLLTGFCSSLPRGMARLSLGGEGAVHFRVPPKKEALEYATKLLEKYAKMIEDHALSD